METIRGKATRGIGFTELTELLAGFNRVLLDLGTGDGRYVHTLARQHPDWFVIGLDSCRENLHERSRLSLPNMLFVIAEAQHLPQELSGLASHLSINFPWGSLLQGLLTGDPALMDGIASVTDSSASVEVRFNAGALAEAGSTLQAGADQIHTSLSRSGWMVDPPQIVEAPALRAFPSTWARRLAVGRDPRAVEMTGWLARRA